MLKYIVLLGSFGLVSACAKVGDVYSLICEPTGKSSGSGSLIGFAINEPKKQIAWMGPVGKFYHIKVSKWTQGSIVGEYKLGNANVFVNIDRNSGTASMNRVGPDVSYSTNVDSCDAEAIDDDKLVGITKALDEFNTASTYQ